ncbi:MAG: hypothetical protein ACKUBY_02765 [Candidatus Moraniibacteriota bacterium]|jgi:hypothetical protein
MNSKFPLQNKIAYDICGKVCVLMTSGKDYEEYLCKELQKNSFTESTTWDIVGTINRDDMHIIKAVIKSKTVSAKAVFFMLKLANFPLEGCICAFNHYHDEILKNRLMIETFAMFNETFLHLRNMRRNQSH